MGVLSKSLNFPESSKNGSKWKYNKILSIFGIENKVEKDGLS